MKLRPKEIRTDRLLLRSILEESKDEMISLLTDREIKKTYMLPDFSSKEEENKYFYRLKSLTEDENRFIYGIYLSNHLIGFTNEVNKTDDYLEIGYFLSPLYWNQGYMTEALGACIKALFDMGYKSVKAAHFEHNLASARVMQKCGMKINNEEEEIEYRNHKYRCIYYQIDNKL